MIEDMMWCWKFVWILTYSPKKKTEAGGIRGMTIPRKQNWQFHKLWNVIKGVERDHIFCKLETYHSTNGDIMYLTYNDNKGKILETNTYFINFGTGSLLESSKRGLGANELFISKDKQSWNISSLGVIYPYFLTPVLKNHDPSTFFLKCSLFRLKA